jgi:quercetin dioxygenase-like cupin family protein
VRYFSHLLSSRGFFARIGSAAMLSAVFLATFAGCTAPGSGPNAANETVGVLLADYDSAPSPVTVIPLLDKADTTILGRSFMYPSTEDVQVSSSIITLQPGAQTGWHLHEAPMYAYILEGTLEVTYKVDGVAITKIYEAGGAIMEGLDVPHNGRNTTGAPVSVLVVNLGAAGVANTVMVEE